MLGNRLKCLSVLLLCLVSPARPATAWLRITSANFELYTNAGEKKGRETIVYFEQARALFNRLAKSKDAPAVPVRIIAFQSDTEYQTYRIPDSTDAFYVDGQDRDYIVMKGIASQFYPATIRQYVQLLIKHSDLDLPVWLSEGLVEVYSPLKAVGSQVQLGENLSGRTYELKNNAWLDFSALLSVDRSSPLYNEKQKAGIFYSESWALTHMLYLSTEYAKKFPDFLALIRAGDSQGGVFEKIYGKTPSQLQEELSNYVRGSSLSASRFNVRLEKSTEFPNVRMATDLESGLALADLLVVTQRRAEAQAAYESLAKSHPKDPEVLAAMAKLAGPNPGRNDAEKAAPNAIKPADGERARELLASVGQPELPAQPAEVIRQPAPQRPVVKPKVPARPKRSVEPVQATQQPATQTHDPESTTPTTRTKRPATPVQATRPPAPKKRNVEPSVETAHVERPADPVQATQQLVPQTPTAQPPEVTTRSAEGTLQQIDCAGKAARLRLLVEGQQMMLLIEDVNKVSMKTAGKNVIREFTCGPQEPVTVAILYSVKPDPMFKTEGLVRTLEFR